MSFNHIENVYGYRYISFKCLTKVSDKLKPQFQQTPLVVSIYSKWTATLIATVVYSMPCRQWCVSVTLILWRSQAVWRTVSRGRYKFLPFSWHVSVVGVEGRDALLARKRSKEQPMSCPWPQQCISLYCRLYVFLIIPIYRLIFLWYIYIVCDFIYNNSVCW